MQDAALVRLCDCACDRSNQFEGSAPRHWTFGHALLQRSAVIERHNDVGIASVGDARFEHGGDIVEGLERGHGLTLSFKAASDSFVTATTQNLHRNYLTGVDVRCLVHVGVSTSAYK